MALRDPQNDPDVDQQLYADLGPDLGNARPIWSDSSFPDSWFSPEDAQLARIQSGSAPRGAGLPAAAAAGLPPTAAAGPPPDLTEPGSGDPGSGDPGAGDPGDAATTSGAPPAPPMHPADMAALGIGPPAFGPPAPGQGSLPPPPATVAGLPDITISQEPAGASAGIGAHPGAPPSPLPNGIPPPVQIQAAPLPSGSAGPVTPEEQHYRGTLQQYAGHIDQIPDPIERQRAYDELYGDGRRIGERAMYEGREAADIKAHSDRVEAQRVQLLKEQQEAREKAFEDWKATQQATEDKMTEVRADVDRIANTKINPSDALNPIQKVAGVIMGLVGGLYQGRMGTSNNIGLDALNTIVNRNIAEMKGNLDRQLQGAQNKMSVLAQEYSRHGDMYRAEQTVRLASYQAADQLLAIEQQNYTPGGTTERKIAAYRAATIGAAQKAGIELNGVVQKQELERREQIRKEQDTLSQMAERKANTSKAYAETTKAYAEAKKLGYEADQLNPAALLNEEYNVPTGQYDPFTGKPIMGKRALTGKGADKGEDKEVRVAINSYHHVQDYWAQLAAIGKEIEFHKSYPETLWKKFKNTDAAAYDAATHALVVHLTKELGDKLTQGQLDEQGKRIPLRADFFESRDVAKLIKSAQEDADRDFSRDMTQAGIDPTPMLLAAQQRRRMVEPTPESEADNARAALAKDPNDKDAQRDLVNAQERITAGVEAQQQRRQDITDARKASPAPTALPEYDAAKDFASSNLGVGDFDPKNAYGKQELAAEATINTAVQDANRAAAHYEALRDKFRDTDSNEHLKGLTLPGDIAVANRAHDQELGSAAAQLLAARQQAMDTQAKAQALLRDKEQQRWYERRIYLTPDEYVAQPDQAPPSGAPPGGGPRMIGRSLELPAHPPPQVLEHWRRELLRDRPLDKR